MISYNRARYSGVVVFLRLLAVLAVAAFSHSLFAAAAPARSQQLTSPDQVPEGLAKSEWSSIRAAYEAGRHAFQPTPTGWQARNPGQQWTTSFDRRGFVATPKAGGWTWGLELQGYGFGARQQTIAGTPVVQAEGSRLTYQWDAAVQEWFVNDQRGLEHGFTVSTRPAADTTALTAPGAQPTALSFLLAVRGGLRPHVTTDALGVEFRDATGATVLNYAGLKVWDADGKILTSHFELAASSPSATGEQHAVRLLVDERGARYPITIDPIAQQAYLKASNTPDGRNGVSDNFGVSVAVSGDTVVVGARSEDSSTTGVNSTPNEDASASGAAYVFVRSGTTWTQQAYLKASNTGAGDAFGWSVAVDGNTVVVGAYGEASSTTGVNSTPNESAANAGAAYVFVRSGTTWTEQAYLKASNTGVGDWFGYVVAVSGDTVVVGAYEEDSSTTGVNSTANEGATDAGAAYVFVRSGTTWTEQAYLKGSNTGVGDWFGNSVGVSGDTVVVGAFHEDSNTTGVQNTATPTTNELFADSGAAYVFVRSGATWSQQAYLKASNAAAGDLFAIVAVSGDTVVVGARREDSNTTGVNTTANELAADSGAAYVFVRSGTTWTQQAYLKASNTGAGDFFGDSVAVSGDTVMVGAYNEDSSTTGANSTSNESATDSGAVYMFSGLGVATVTTPTSASIAATSATLGGDVTSDGGAAITARGIVYAPTATNSNPQIGGTDVTTVAGSGTTGVFTVSASGLTANTAYTYAAYATTSAGTTYSSTGTFTTLPLPPAITNGTLTASGTYGSAITTYTITGSNIPTSYSATGLPAGLSLDSATGAITGTPTTTIGSPFSVTIGATNTGGTGTATLVLTVAKATPTISVAPTASGITYGQTLASSTLSSGTASVAGAFAFTTTSTAPNAGTAAQGVTFTPSDTTNYNTATTTVNVTVAKATPTISVAPTASGITYGQTLASSTLSSGTTSTAGTFTFTTTSTAPNAGTASQAVTFTPSDTTNYNATTTTVNVTVAKATPTITWATPSSITYGTMLSATQLNASGSVAGTFTYSPASGTTPNAGTQTLSVGFVPTDTANYNVVSATTVSLTVGQASQTITFDTLANKTYGAAPFSVAATASSSLTPSYSIVSGPATLSGSTVTLTGAGTVVVRTSQAGDGNFTAATPVDQSFTVAKATLTVTADAKSRVYGAANPTLTATITGFVNSETSTVISGAAAVTTATTTTSTVGDYAITAAVGTLSATNYDFSFTAGTLTVSKAALTVTADAKSRTYGDANPTLTATITGYANSETSSVVSGTPVLSTGASATSDVGGYTITAALGSLSATNYSFSLTNGTLTVGKAPLTVTADNQTKVYGDANPAFTATITGFKNSQTTAVLTGTAALSTAATTASGVNSYAITPALGTLVSANYSFGFVDGALAVTKAPLTVTADAKNRAYGAANPTFTATLTGFVNSDTSAVVTGAAALSSTVTPTSVAGSYPITPAIGTLTAANYAFTTFTNGTLTVGQTSQTITFGALASKTFGDAAFSVSATSTSGLTPSYSIVSGPATISGATVTITGAGTVVVRSSQAGDGNYTAATPVDQSFTVNKATPAITWATPGSIAYGTTLSATQLNASGSVAGSITYSPASGAILSVGTQTLNATFTPTDTANYNPASASVALSVGVAAPGSPTAIVATTANGEATVTFTAPSFTGSAAITGYTIRATAADGSIVTVNATGSPAKVTGLTPGKSYRFTVTANNSAGSSESSTTSDALAISLVNQTITFASLADRVSNSGSFALSATASSGLPVTFTLVSGPGLLAGNVVDLTGATGTIKLRASQAGNATYAAAPAVEVTFAVTAGRTNVVFGQAFRSDSRVPAAELGLVLPGNGQAGSLLVVSTLIPGLNGVITLQPTGSGGFIGTLVSTVAAAPLDARIQAAPVTYTITGTLLNGVLTGTIAPMGLVFTAPVPLPTGPSAAAAGLYATGALVQATGAVYAVVGANNEVLVLLQSATVTTGGTTTLKPDTTFALAAPGNVTLTGGVNPTTTTATATLTVPGTAPVVFSGLSTTTKRTDRLIGLASRAKVGTGESVLITGLAIGGTESKRVLIRAGGPALAGFGLTSTLTNPTLKIYRGSTLIAQNDDWNPADAAEMARLGIFAFPNGSKDAAILTTLEPGSYTAHVSDLSGTGTGVALAEIYDASVNPTADYQRLVSIASRGTVTVGDGALIGGFVVVGNSPKTLLIRGIGPTLSGFGLVGALADPVLTIYQDGEALATNAGWANLDEITTAGAQAGAFALVAGSRDAALLVTLKPGAYTAQIKAAQSASSGVALIEIYEVP